MQPTPTPTRLATSGRRYLRSRDGCRTCKHRKVKCNEQRPRCSHCERLNLECKWRPLTRPATQATRQISTSTDGPNHSLSPATDDSSRASVFQPANAVNDVFDYASFLWESEDFWQQATTETEMIGTLNPRTLTTNPAPANTAAERDFNSASLETPVTDSNEMEALVAALPPGSEKLVQFFASSPNPPIIAEVEAPKKWFAMRQAVVQMASNSRMVRDAIMAFSNLLLCRQEATCTDERAHYENAVAEVLNCDSAALVEYTPLRTHLLAALFFLSYIDILESRLGAAHSNLKRAYTIFQQSNRASFSSVEKQLLLWIRLLDGRAVSAGGDGLFLSDDEELLQVQPSPASSDGDFDGHSRHDTTDGDIADVLFQVLYQPGITFFQKTQSFMGRVSKIDPWHRSRGTVEDETEVMNIGAGIAADLRTLYDRRPPLMDYAVAGKLTEPHVSAHLAFVLSRAFRTYLSNYYACKVHLHRVAYKTLPLTREASDALDQIRKLARQIVQDLGAEDSLPATMLWPLLMLGAEEQDAGEKAWIKAQILKMEKVAGNARITAQVLEEVQLRQDAAGARMDIRSVMHAVFNSCFAIV